MSNQGPNQTPKQRLLTSFFAFVLPVIVIIALVLLTSKNHSKSIADSNDTLAQAQRIQRVGSVELRDANRPLQTGEAVFKAQCSACHATGLVGAPKFGNAAEWGARLGAGYDTLLNSALKGKGNMSAQGGGAFTDVEIGRAVVYMANAAGGKFAEPAAPAPAQ